MNSKHLGLFIQRKECSVTHDKLWAVENVGHLISNFIKLFGTVLYVEQR